MFVCECEKTHHHCPCSVRKAARDAARRGPVLSARLEPLGRGRCSSLSRCCRGKQALSVAVEARDKGLELPEEHLEVECRLAALDLEVARRDEQGELERGQAAQDDAVGRWRRVE